MERYYWVWKMSEEEIALKILEISVGGNSRNVDYCVDDYFKIIKRVRDENMQEGLWRKGL